MPALCYILYSKSFNKFYVGATDEAIEQRLEKHNNQSYGSHRYTATTNDWEVYLILETNDYAHAIRTKRKIKSHEKQGLFRKLKEIS